MKEMAIAAFLTLAKFTQIYIFYLIGWILLWKLLLQRPTRESPQRRGHVRP